MPHLANAAAPGRGLRLRPGLTLAIEPLGGAPHTRTGPDGWTVFTKDGARRTTIGASVHGPRILTAP